MLPASSREAKLWEEGTLRRLSLQEAIELALVNNLDVRIESLTPKIEQANTRAAWGAFDPTLSLSTLRESIDRPQNAQEFVAAGGGSSQEQTIIANEEVIINNQAALIERLDNIMAAINNQPAPNPNPQEVQPPVDSTARIDSGRLRIFEEDNVRSQAGIEGRIPLGTRYRLFLATNEFENTLNQNSAAPFSPEYSTTAGITLTQPLLRGFGPAANLAGVRISRKNAQIADYTWQTRLINAVGTTMSIYYDLAFAVKNIGVKEDAIELARALVTENRRRLELGVMSPFDVSQAEVAVSTGQEDLLTANNFMMERQNALKRQVLGEFNMDDNRILFPTDELDAAVPPLDRHLWLRAGFENRLDYKQAVTEAEREDIRVRYTRNQLLPRLDVQGTYALSGIAGSYSKSFSNVRDQQGPLWNAGVIFSIPLGNVEARAAHDVSKYRKEQAILNIERVELTIGIDVDTILGRVETNVQRIKTASRSRQLAEEALKIGEKRLAEGVATSFNVLELQRDLSTVRSRQLAAEADLSKSIVQLWVASGTLLDKSGINIDKGKASLSPKPR